MPVGKFALHDTFKHFKIWIGNVFLCQYIESQIKCFVGTVFSRVNFRFHMDHEKYCEKYWKLTLIITAIFFWASYGFFKLLKYFIFFKGSIWLFHSWCSESLWFSWHDNIVIRIDWVWNLFLHLANVRVNTVYLVEAANVSIFIRQMEISLQQAL